MPFSFYLAQVLAGLGCLLASISYFKKERLTYLFLQVGASALYIVEYLLLGIPSGVVNNGVWILKFAVFIYLAYRGKKPPQWLTFLFCGIGVVMGLFALNTPYDWVPIIVSLLFTVAVAWGNPYFLRSVVIAGDVGWILYNLNGAAYVSAAYSLVEGVATLVSLCLLIAGVKKEKPAPEQSEDGSSFS